MAKTKAELIDEAKGKGLELTGDETVADLQKLLKEDPEPEPEPEPEAAPEPEQPTKGKHVLVDLFGAGSFTLYPAPPGYNADAPDRTILIDGRNCEHVSTHPSGVWEYRGM